jgi:hypothetical protein
VFGIGSLIYTGIEIGGIFEARGLKAVVLNTKDKIHGTRIRKEVYFFLLFDLAATKED